MLELNKDTSQQKSLETLRNARFKKVGTPKSSAFCFRCGEKYPVQSLLDNLPNHDRPDKPGVPCGGSGRRGSKYPRERINIHGVGGAS